jgi:hypothetical protein
MFRTVSPWPDIITTIVRRSRTGFFALRLIRWSSHSQTVFDFAFVTGRR